MSINQQSQRASSSSWLSLTQQANKTKDSNAPIPHQVLLVIDVSILPSSSPDFPKGIKYATNVVLAAAGHVAILYDSYPEIKVDPGVKKYLNLSPCLFSLLSTF